MKIVYPPLLRTSYTLFLLSLPTHATTQKIDVRHPEKTNLHYVNYVLKHWMEEYDLPYNALLPQKKKIDSYIGEITPITDASRHATLYWHGQRLLMIHKYRILTETYDPLTNLLSYRGYNNTRIVDVSSFRWNESPCIAIAGKNVVYLPHNKGTTVCHTDGSICSIGSPYHPVRSPCHPVRSPYRPVRSPCLQEKKILMAYNKQHSSIDIWELTTSLKVAYITTRHKVHSCMSHVLDPIRACYDPMYPKSNPITAFSPKYELFASLGLKNAIYLYHVTIEKITLLKRLWGHKKEVTAFTFSYDGKKLFSISKDQNLFIWDFDNKKCKICKHKKIPKKVSPSPCGRYVATLTSGPHPLHKKEDAYEAHIWSIEKGVIICSAYCEEVMLDLKWNPIGDKIALAGRTKTYLWNVYDLMRWGHKKVRF